MKALNTECYPTTLFLPCHTVAYIPVIHLNFLSDWSSNPHAEKEKIQKVSPFPVSPMQCNLS